MRVVGVTQRVDYFPDREEKRDAIDQRLIDFISFCGGLAVPIPNTLAEQSKLEGWVEVIKPSAFIFSGGNDIGVNLERDITELKLLDYAHDKRLPVLGICRGMQVMAKWGGAELKPVIDHARTRHKIKGEVVGNVNSYHRFSITDAPANSKIIARSEDGEIEAIKNILVPWEGWMWHPEREGKFSWRDTNRFQRLLK